MSRRTDYLLPAVFLDRDGTLNYADGYIRSPEELNLIPGTGNALKLLTSAGFLLFIFTNQAGIGKGLMGLADFWKVQRELETQLSKFGVKFTDVLFCPHSPTANCPCRKPSPYLIELAFRRYPISRTDSWLIGDSERDLIAGYKAGLKLGLVLTGKTKREDVCKLKVKPHIIGETLLDIAKAIVADRVSV